MNAFAYPKQRHVRTEAPRHYADYTRYKPALRTDFLGKCVYCRDADGVRGDWAFGVDHYRPKGKFPALRTEYANLFYSCNTCNTWKNEYWVEPVADAAFVPNPCDHVMHEHFRFDDGMIVGKTPAGKLAVALLHFNDDRTVSSRRTVAQAVDALRAQAIDARRHVRAVKRRVGRKAPTAADQDEIETFSDLYRRAEAALAGFGATVD